MKLVSAFILCLLSSVVSAQGVAPASANTKYLDSVDSYQGRYRLRDPFTKLVDNHGDGFLPLYGTRNFRSVLGGVIYRGGANNKYNRHSVRGNQNPLPDEGLQNLCEEGFSDAIYLYGEGFGRAPKSTTCRGPAGANQLRYHSIQPLSSDGAARSILKMIAAKLQGEDPRPIYLHCWNGWHASGFISALTLRQFCGWSGDQAVRYWDRNTDGNNGSEFNGIRRRIRAFKPDPSLRVDPRLVDRICPR